MQDFQTELKKAFSIHQAGELDKAIRLYLKMLKQKPQDWQLLYLLGTAYTQTNHFEKAINFLKKSIDINPKNAPSHNNLGNSLKAINHSKEALTSYCLAIDIDPKYVEAFFNLGNCLKDLGQYQEAIKAFNNAISLKDDYYAAFVQCGNTYHLLHKYSDAITKFDRAITINTKPIEAYLNKGAALVSLNRLDEAQACMQKIIDIAPHHFEAHLNLGILYRKLNKLELALQSFQTAIELNPRESRVHNNFAAVLTDLKNYNAALHSYEKAISLNPKYTEALNNKALVHILLKEYEQALLLSQQAIKVEPEYAEAHNNLGTALKGLNRLFEAVECFSRAIQLKPNYAIGYNNRGITLHLLRRYEDALSDFNFACDLDKNFSEAHHNRAVILQELNRLDEALSSYQVACNFNPNLEYARGAMLHLKMHICDWSNFEESINNLVKDINLNHKASTPFGLLGLIDDPEIHKIAGQIYLNDKHPKNLFDTCLPNSLKRKIKIGYFSADFYGHAMMHLMADLFKNHDHERFEVFAFSIGPIIQDEWRNRIEKYFNKFFECNTLSDSEISKLSRDLEIDIAVDLNGFTTNSRPGIFSFTPAPIIVNFLGYPGTIGVSHYDYIIADEVLVPENSRIFYSEKIAYLPGSYQPNCRYQLVSDKNFTRQDFGLPEDAFIFSSFNNNYKIIPNIFNSWMNILKSSNNSVLWLYAKNKIAQDNLKKNAQIAGIDPSRIFFTSPLPTAEHLRRYQVSNLMLDTFPYGAHTTCSEALRMELPIVTMKGRSFASRVGASLLTNIGLPELITDSFETYELKAIELANNQKLLENIKQRLIKNKLSATLFDPIFFTQKIEYLYSAMHKRYSEGLKPDHLWAP